MVLPCYRCVALIRGVERAMTKLTQCLDDPVRYWVQVIHSCLKEAEAFGARVQLILITIEFTDSENQWSREDT